MKENNNLVKRLVLTAAFSALIIVMTFTNLGFIQFSPVVSITILPIPVALVAILVGLPEGIFAGFIFGLMSLIKAAMSPSGVLDPLFVNPLCSVLPRMLFAAVAWGVWKLLKLLFESIPNKSISKYTLPVAAVITGFVATFCHTLLVYGCIFLFKGADMRAALDSIGMTGLGYFAVVGVGIVSELCEALACAVVCGAVYSGVVIAGNRKSKLSSVAEEKDSE